MNIPYDIYMVIVIIIVVINNMYDCIYGYYIYNSDIHIP
jgi:hypothetical protein